jgi:hypothetical protein
VHGRAGVLPARAASALGGIPKQILPCGQKATQHSKRRGQQRSD